MGGREPYIPPNDLLMHQMMNTPEFQEFLQTRSGNRNQNRNQNGSNIDPTSDKSILDQLRELLGGEPEEEEVVEEQEEFEIPTQPQLPPQVGAGVPGEPMSPPGTASELLGDVAGAIGRLPRQAVEGIRGGAAKTRLAGLVRPDHPDRPGELLQQPNEPRGGVARAIIDHLLSIEDPAQALEFAEIWLTPPGVQEFIRQRDGVR